MVKPQVWPRRGDSSRVPSRQREAQSNAMFPASSVSGMYFNHPDSKYFAVGKLAKDQVEDYTLRKDQWLEVSERWLAPYLDYEPTA